MNHRFDVIMVDEAGTTTPNMEFACLLRYGKPNVHYYAVGDPLQQPPILAVDINKNLTSLYNYKTLTSTFHLSDEALLLLTNYRNPRMIVDFVSPFYRGQLVSAPGAIEGTIILIYYPHGTSDADVAESFVRTLTPQSVALLSSHKMRNIVTAAAVRAGYDQFQPYTIDAYQGRESEHIVAELCDNMVTVSRVIVSVTRAKASFIGHSREGRTMVWHALAHQLDKFLVRSHGLSFYVYTNNQQAAIERLKLHTTDIASSEAGVQLIISADNLPMLEERVAICCEAEAEVDPFGPDHYDLGEGYRSGDLVPAPFCGCTNCDLSTPGAAIPLVLSPETAVVPYVELEAAAYLYVELEAAADLSTMPPHMFSDFEADFAHIYGDILPAVDTKVAYEYVAARISRDSNPAWSGLVSIDVEGASIANKFGNTFFSVGVCINLRASQYHVLPKGGVIPSMYRRVNANYVRDPGNMTHYTDTYRDRNTFTTQYLAWVEHFCNNIRRNTRGPITLLTYAGRLDLAFLYPLLRFGEPRVCPRPKCQAVATWVNYLSGSAKYACTLHALSCSLLYNPVLCDHALGRENRL